MNVERVCGVVRAALGAGSAAACSALQRHRVCGLALSVCRLGELKPILELPFGDWELFQLLITNLRELEANLPINAPAVNVIAEKSSDAEPEAVKQRPVIEHQRSRPSNVEKQVTLEEQMICGALQTLNEEAMEDVLQSEPPSHPDEENELQLRVTGGAASLVSSAAASPAGSPRAPRRDPSILKGGSFRARRPPGEPPAVTFNVENEEDSDEGQITFSVRPCSAAHYRAAPAGALRSRPSSLLVATDDALDSRISVRSQSVEDSTKTGSPIVDLKVRNLRKTAEILKKVSSADRLSRLKDKLMRGSGSRERSPAREEGSDDESAPLVASAPGSPVAPAAPQQLGVECAQDTTASSDLSPRSDLTELESPRADFDLLPEGKGEAAPRERMERVASFGSVSNMVEPYNLRLLARGASDARALWRQDALDTGPPWPWDEPDSAV